MSSNKVRAVSIVAVALAAWAFTAVAVSAQTGTVSGVITAQTTGQPLSNVQVFIEDLNIGSLSQANGRYLLIAVPVGTYELGLSSIGYGSQTVQVTVSAEQITQLNSSEYRAAWGINIKDDNLTGPKFICVLSDLLNFC